LLRLHLINSKTHEFITFHHASYQLKIINQYFNIDRSFFSLTVIIVTGTKNYVSPYNIKG
jgi:hypothetical protein